jgi:hypothetical protein
MKCRRINYTKDESGIILRRDIVWFGSYGKNNDGTAKFYNPEDKHDNYGNEKEAVADGLTQRLNVLRGELWYAVNEGMPLWDNHKNTYILDTYITSTVLKHSEVKSIISFNSSLSSQNDQLVYSATMIILSNYGELAFDVTKGL